MTPEQQAAYIISQSVSAMAEIEGMRAENQIRESRGQAMAYDHGAFVGIIEVYDIDKNTVIDLFRESNES